MVCAETPATDRINAKTPDAILNLMGYMVYRAMFRPWSLKYKNSHYGQDYKIRTIKRLFNNIS